MNYFKPCIIPIALFSANVFAEDPKPFEAEAELGAIMTSGNTESTAIKGKLDINQEFTSWRTNYILEALYKEDEVDIVVDDVETTESQVTAEKYYGAAQADYKLNEDYRGLFIFGSYEDDKFSGYEYQSTIAAGYSDRFFKTDNSRFLYSIGPGYSFYELEDTVEDDGTVITGESEGSLIVRIALDYELQLNENAKFIQLVASDIATESGKNTKTRSETALTTKISDDFAFKASVIITNNSEVVEDKENTDVQTALTLVYSF